MMAERTGIQWCDATWNPHYGCRKVSQGCAKCYAEREMTKYGRPFTTVQRAKPSTFYAPLAWAKNGKVEPGARIFTCSWSDWFIEEADPWRDEAWKVIEATPQFNYLILTKRPERMEQCMPERWLYPWDMPRNIWLGISAERQDKLDARWPVLESLAHRWHPSVVFLSLEPLLGPIDLSMALDDDNVGDEDASYFLRPADWVIAGGESDLKAPRPCDLDWLRSLRDQCDQAGVHFFLKQLGGSKKIDGAWGGRTLDGRTWDEFPVRKA